ncbi:TPA: 50S ribosomal protein L6 [Candidatus Woesearchaeota archaeon]|nr:large subunit ribosomal protein L6 [uncultured archaeon]KHO51229.1 MAG: large subunit ribosomal protein L6 [archaeon GW2011_AR11]HIH04667.1 50S ribosomal protein L6 [Candidatus Woesearchaeota archaeon]HIH91389.1 50S ribosomal protein L6 [Candidatus Woesearchaeota archaeon]HII64449.1 50S ribosomal protein L6 [Candidatus Woesearchaeota archaeon]
MAQQKRTPGKGTGAAQKGKQEKMSATIELPQGITASFTDGVLTLKGQKGEASHSIEERKVSLQVQGATVIVTGKGAAQKDKMMVGTVEAHVRNLVRGVQEPYKYTLKICSGHFPMTVAVQGDKLTIKNFFGEKVPRMLHLKKGAAVKVEGDKITVESSSKETAGQVSADIEQLVRRPGFDTRIFQDGIYIINKHGKEIK